MEQTSVQTKVVSDLNDAARKFSAFYPVMDNAVLRRIRGLKIAAIVREALDGKKIERILDVGCSNALVLDTVVEELDPGFAVGIDMDAAVAPVPTAKRTVVIGDAMTLPLASMSIDVVICNHTYEHVPDPRRLFSEINRVLKADGIVYFSAMNARWPMEPHYHMPFIHWLPEKMARAILRFRGFPAGYLEKPLSTPKLVELVSAFEIHDYTLKVITHPEKYHAQDIVRFSIFGHIYRYVAGIFYGALPGYIWILRKRPGTLTHTEKL